MMRNTCFFIGHRDAPETLRPILEEEVERHIVLCGVSEFVVGHYGLFDAMAADSVRKAKKRHPEVTLTLLLPYYPPTCDTSEYDCTYYPAGMENTPKPFAIVRANEYMIRHCDYLICFCTGQIGKTRDYYELALMQEKKGYLHIDNLAELLMEK